MKRPTLKLKSLQELDPEALAKLPKFRGRTPEPAQDQPRARHSAPVPALIHITRAAVEAMDARHSEATCPFCQEGKSHA